MIGFSVRFNINYSDATVASSFPLCVQRYELILIVPDFEATFLKLLPSSIRHHSISLTPSRLETVLFILQGLHLILIWKLKTNLLYLHQK